MKAPTGASAAEAHACAFEKFIGPHGELSGQKNSDSGKSSKSAQNAFIEYIYKCIETSYSEVTFSLYKVAP